MSTEQQLRQLQTEIRQLLCHHEHWHTFTTSDATACREDATCLACGARRVTVTLRAPGEQSPAGPFPEVDA